MRRRHKLFLYQREVVRLQGSPETVDRCDRFQSTVLQQGDVEAGRGTTLRR